MNKLARHKASRAVASGYLIFCILLILVTGGTEQTEWLISLIVAASLGSLWLLYEEYTIDHLETYKGRKWTR